MAETATAGPRAGAGPLDQDELEHLGAWWRAANYLSVDQIYLLDNLLLRPGSPPPAEAATDPQRGQAA